VSDLSDIYVNTLNDVTVEVPHHFVTNASSLSHRGTCICLEQTMWRKWIISDRIFMLCSVGKNDYMSTFILPLLYTNFS
jgi:hypothetical protein